MGGGLLAERIEGRITAIARVLDEIGASRGGISPDNDLASWIIHGKLAVNRALAIDTEEPDWVVVTRDKERSGISPLPFPDTNGELLVVVVVVAIEGVFTKPDGHDVICLADDKGMGPSHIRNEVTAVVDCGVWGLYRGPTVDGVVSFRGLVRDAGSRRGAGLQNWRTVEVVGFQFREINALVGELV